MDGNVCDSLEEDVCPPPRKRLLAGYKKQNGIEQSASPPTPTTPTEVDARVKNLLSSSDCSGSVSGCSSLEQIAESSKKAALAAAEVAESARTAAEEKAAIAAKAIATAKCALELVSSFYKETSGRDRDARKNKSKKQVTTHSLFKKQYEVENGKSDGTEQKVHRGTHNSSMLYKESPASPDSKILNHKKHKVSSVIGKPKLSNGKVTSDNGGSSHKVPDALGNEKRSQCSSKLISSNWRVEKDIITINRKARKQLIHM